MCLTTEAFALFLNLISSDLITSEPGRITINAEVAKVRWIATGEHWCTEDAKGVQRVRFYR